MKTASVVIGAGYGDEGKGLVTSTLAHDHDLVVRFSGGSQAAHTVYYKGMNHIFHHFGSGSLQYKPTYLSEHFIVNPITFGTEQEALKEYGIDVSVFIDANCRMTTPFDMLINQALETKRGKDRHGSCGMGINETVLRCTDAHYDFSVYNVAKNMKHMKDMLMCMFDEYYTKRADMLDLDIKYFKNKDDINSIVDHYVLDFVNMIESSTLVDSDILTEFEHVLFEGSQGLMLDEEYGEFPHVTRARTGMTNVLEIMKKEMSDEIPRVYYVTRHYATRHGAGVIEHEFDGAKIFPDATNVPNQWQGSLRYGFLDLNILRETIKKDKVSSFRNNLVVTCLDQKHKLAQSSDYVFSDSTGTIRTMKKKAFLKTIAKDLKLKVWYTDSKDTKRRLKK